MSAMTPPRASAWAHLLSRVALSRRGRATTTSVSTLCVAAATALQSLRASMTMEVRSV
ncbi:Uncharacterised protein [Bordetella pertussis]|nr:Uncharacterised protein [Bordetella pertussis]